MNDLITLKPSPKYLTKLIVSILLWGLASLISAGLLSWGLSFAPDIGTKAATTVFAICAGITLLAVISALIVAYPYYRSLSYEICTDEVIVKVGVITSSIKHVPYRTVTNITIKRGILDRWIFNLGTLNIQTAGMSGTAGAEESLLGLDDVSQVYTLVVRELRKFRGAMAPTASDMELEDQLGSFGDGKLSSMLGHILQELKAIHQLLENTA